MVASEGSFAMSKGFTVVSCVVSGLYRFLTQVTSECEGRPTLLPKNAPNQSIPVPSGAGDWGSLDDYLPQRFLLDGFGFPILLACVGSRSRSARGFRDEAPGSQSCAEVPEAHDEALRSTEIDRNLTMPSGELLNLRNGLRIAGG